MTGSSVPWPLGPQAPVFVQGWHPFASDALAAGFDALDRQVIFF